MKQQKQNEQFAGDRDGSVVGSDPGGLNRDGFVPTGEFRFEDFTRAGVEGCGTDGPCVRILSDRSTLDKQRASTACWRAPSRPQG